MIERPARGEPFTVWATPETATPLVYFKEAGDAMLRLADAPAEAIRTVNYVIDGIKPAPTAGEEAEAVRRRVPSANIRFEPDPAIQPLLDKGTSSIDDSCARQEGDGHPPSASTPWSRTSSRNCAATPSATPVPLPEGNAVSDARGRTPDQSVGHVPRPSGC